MLQKALDLNGTAVGFDNPFANAQPEPVAFARASLTGLIESLKNA